LLPLSYFSGIELKLKGLLGSAEKWETIEDIKNIFCWKKTTMSGRLFFPIIHIMNNVIEIIS